MPHNTIRVKPQGGTDPLACGTARRCYQSQDRARLIAEHHAKRLDSLPAHAAPLGSARVFSRIPYRARPATGVRVYVPGADRKGR